MALLRSKILRHAGTAAPTTWQLQRAVLNICPHHGCEFWKMYDRPDCGYHGAQKRPHRSEGVS